MILYVIVASFLCGEGVCLCIVFFLCVFEFAVANHQELRVEIVRFLLSVYKRFNLVGIKDLNVPSLTLADENTVWSKNHRISSNFLYKLLLGVIVGDSLNLKPPLGLFLRKLAYREV